MRCSWIWRESREKKIPFDCLLALLEEIERPGLMYPGLGRRYEGFEDGVEHVTILPKNGACIFLLEESKGFRQCLFEKLYLEGRTDFQKPISCHLFPLIFRQTKYHKILSFQRRNICLPSWNHGEHLLKNLEPALKRKFGNTFVSKLFEKLQFEEY